MKKNFLPTSLMLGNLATGLALLGPTAMLAELATSLSTGVREAGLLITYGAIALCIAAPLGAWVSSSIDRRLLLAGTIAGLALCAFASALAPNYESLLVVRIIMALIVAQFSPQAASVMASLAPPEKRASSMAYVFLGWSLTTAVGLPLIAVLANQFGWRAVYTGIGVISTISALLLAWKVPRGLRGEPVVFSTWTTVFRNRFVLLMLSVSIFALVGQFILMTFIGPIMSRTTGVGPEGISVTFLLFGVAAFAGMVNAARIVDRWGALNTSIMCISLATLGMLVWTVGMGSFAVMLAGIIVWGFGFGGITSMQQVRLVSAAPLLAAVTISLNTSVLYIGQSIGSAIGGLYYAGDHFVLAGGTAVCSLLVALGISVYSRRSEQPQA